MYLDCTVVLGLYNRGTCITYTPPPSVCAKKSSKKIIVSIVVGICRLNLDYVNCIWIVLIVFGLCDFILDCMIVFGFYDCILIMSIVFGLYGIWQRGCNIASARPPLVPKKFYQKRIARVQECSKGYTWIVRSNVELCRLQIACQSC